MSKLKFVLLCLLAAFAASAVSASSASAFSWWIENSKAEEVILKEGEKELFNEEAVVHSPWILKWSGSEVVCDGADYDEGYIEGLVKLGAKAVSLTKCKVGESTTCAVEGEKLTTSELVGEIKKGSGSKVTFELKPKKEPFAEFKLVNVSGKTCLLKGTYTIEGTTGGEITNPKELTKEKSFLVQDSLSVNKTAAEAKGEIGYSATKGWSAH
jgi:hypothetical protein